MAYGLGSLNGVRAHGDQDSWQGRHFHKRPWLACFAECSLKIGPGWTKKTKDAPWWQCFLHPFDGVARAHGHHGVSSYCATTPQRMQAVDRPENKHMRVGKVNSCFAYAEHREVIGQLWPDLYKPKTEPAAE